MYINTDDLPEDITAQDCINHYKAYGMVINDPTKTLNNIPSSVNTSTTSSGIWGQIRTEVDSREERLRHMEEEMKLVKTDLKLSRLKILSLEGKFNQEEVANLRKMIMSEDEAARTLADSIIENA